jgi:hypothetical protein
VCARVVPSGDALMLTCPRDGCEAAAHVVCLAEHFLRTSSSSSSSRSSASTSFAADTAASTSRPANLPNEEEEEEEEEEEDADTILPVEGRCPACRQAVRWIDLVRELSLRLRGANEVEALLRPARTTTTANKRRSGGRRKEAEASAEAGDGDGDGDGDMGDTEDAQGGNNGSAMPRSDGTGSESRRRRGREEEEQGQEGGRRKKKKKKKKARADTPSADDDAARISGDDYRDGGDHDESSNDNGCALSLSSRMSSCDARVADYGAVGALAPSPAAEEEEGEEEDDGGWRYIDEDDDGNGNDNGDSDDAMSVASSAASDVSRFGAGDARAGVAGGARRLEIVIEDSEDDMADVLAL